MNLGLALGTIRRALGWTQAQMAERLDCSAKYISQLELGKRSPSLDFLWQFAGVTRCDLSAIILTAEDYAEYAAAWAEGEAAATSPETLEDYTDGQD